MRLLHTTSLLFEEFFDSDIPPYAILSHRWEGKEVGFHEFEAAKERDGPEFSKIKNFCSFTRRALLNSPKRSIQCSDGTKMLWCASPILSSVNAGSWKAQREQFRESPWFTRGWTLQELIAPEDVYFLDRQWNIIGEKVELEAEISDITGIEKAHLNISNDTNPFSDQASIATKMSWVSKRKTSRPEDMAYCLLGIFQINMPLLYGEGEKVFMRLQLEIIRKSDDESIFAWTDPRKITQPPCGYHGMLAPWPTWFANCEGIMTDASSRPPYSMTNKGLEFCIPVYTSPQESMRVALNCYKRFDGGALRVTIDLHSLYYNVGYRSTGNGAEFEGYTESEDLYSNTDIIYIPQVGM